MNAFPPISTFLSWICRRTEARIEPVTSPLAKRETVRGILVAGQALQCVRGVLWITSDADRRDVLLRAGERFAFGSKARLVIEALEDSVVKIR
jgi:hypothetical protein